MIKFNEKKKGVHGSSSELQPRKQDPVLRKEGQSNLGFFTAFLVKWTPWDLEFFGRHLKRNFGTALIVQDFI